MATLERIIMADAMQGIMSLPPEMGGMDQGPRSFFTPEDEAVLNQLRSSISPREFSDEMFNAAEQVDPQAVAELRMMLQGLQLPADLVELLKQMVDMLLAEPARYQEMRQKFLAEGVPEDLLPPEFDPNFFAALNMALDQVSGPPVQGFAGGGMAMTPIAGGIASLGRYGDTMLAHITPQEAMMLRRAGGSGSINPATGLPEFFNLFKAIGSAFKSVGKAIAGAVRGVVRGVKKFAQSSIGRIITSVALGFFLGPAAAGFLGVSSAAGVAAVSGFIGGAGSTLLAGGSLKDALKAGAIGGILGGGGSYLSGGANALQAGSYTGPTTIAGQYNKFAQSVADASRNLSGGSAQIRLPGSDVKPMVSLAETVDDAAIPTATAKTAPAPMAAAADEVVGSAPTGGASTYPNPDGTFTLTKFDKLGQPISSSRVDQLGQPISTGGGAPPVSAPPVSQASLVENLKAGQFAPRPSPTFTGMQGTPPSTGQLYGLRPEGGGVGLRVPGGAPAGGGSPYQLDTMAGGAPPPPAPTPGYRELLGKGDFTGIAEKVGDDVVGAYDKYLSPNRPAIQTATANAEVKALDAVNRLPAGTPESIKLATYNRVLEANTPGMLSTYGPLAAAGLGTAYLAGAFDVPPPPKPDIPTSGAELYRLNPYLITPKIRTISASTGAPVRFAAQGGIMSLAGGTQNFPRKTGPINGPGTGTSDSIPAMLSDGEFVFTAKAVRAMGKGSRRKGAKRMYALMKALEKRA